MNQQKPEITEEQAIDDSFVNSLEDVVSILEGIGPSCFSIQDLIDMTKLAIKNPSQRELMRSHLAPKMMMRR